MWKLELDEYFFVIYDSKRQIVGYFDPDYAQEVDSEEDNDKIIETMLKNHAVIKRGFLTLPLLKFRIFDSPESMSIDYIEKQIDSVKTRIAIWKNFLNEFVPSSSHDHNQTHAIHVSHTDQDMLSITIPIIFSKLTRLEKNEILQEINSTLDQMHKLALI